MILLLLKRIGFMLFTMVVVSIILFLLLETGLTGDPATRVLGNFASDEQKEMWRDQHGYNQPTVVRYAKWLGNFATGNLGTSIRYKGPVKEVLLPRLWNTAILGFWTFAIMIPLSLILGVLSGMKEGSMLDRTISVFGILTTSVPEFASAVFFSALFVFGLKWLPGTSSMIGLPCGSYAENRQERFQCTFRTSLNFFYFFAPISSARCRDVFASNASLPAFQLGMVSGQPNMWAVSTSHSAFIWSLLSFKQAM
ncbi:ABC transporter permease [Desulfosarcina sp.]|uniref:ABC transporter permease n=1 Tax=Desulfosarcina sp. TaxID=2027861 RepID=UPI0029AE1998|nr:ABC transporter permease [Desulfosarcina sp.]MDX2454914.1 ABC transporter permease [Desulfosarcina sp.]MDX2492496.1 ABC transporter permease [Desulfosarcina sp.]